MATTAVTAVCYVARDDRLYLRNVRNKLFMLMNIAQPAPTLWAAMQPGSFRLINLLRPWLLPPGKLSLARFAPRLLRMLHQFPPSKRRCLTLPGTLQFIHFCSQKFVLLLQFLDPLESLNQLLLQLRNSLVFRARLGGLVPLVAHLPKFTALCSFHSESFGLRFSEV
jgi:hypothetical protein